MFVLSAHMAHSPDDISGFSTLSGDDQVAIVNMPFSVTYDGTSYSSFALSTNGWLEFGSTSIFSDLSNDCLPTSSHTNPFVAFYWDDLVTLGSNIRYGSVGTSPNRVYIIDFECDTWSSDWDVRGQVQIHESSGLINVKYRDPMEHGANGQNATIGFQLNTSKVYPIVCNGKVLDDNRDNEGWSVCPVR